MRPSENVGMPDRLAGWPLLASWCTLLAMLLFSRPFQGIYHDASFYAVQTLRRLDPTRYETDLFFAFGNQDSFSLFTSLYAPFVDLFGLPAANALAYGLGLAFWFLGLVLLVRVLFGDPKARIAATAGGLVLSAGYGDGALTYGENFVTPRVFAEAFIMFSLTGFLTKRSIFGGLAAIPVFLLHPLMGLALLSLLLWLMVQDLRKFVLICLLGLLAIALMGLAGVQPFTWVWTSLDPEWYRFNQEHNALVLAHGWAIEGWSNLPTKVLILFYILKHDHGARHRLAKAIAVVAPLMLAMSFVFADLLGNRLFTGLQLWRVLLMVSLSANLLAFHAVHLMPASRGRTLFVLALVTNVIETSVGLNSSLSAILSVSAAAVLFAEHVSRRPFGQILRALTWLPVLLVGFSLVTVISLQAAALNNTLQIFELALLPFASLALVWFLSSSDLKGLQQIATCIILVAAVLTIDRRGDWTSYIEDPDKPLSTELSELIDGKTVYWEDGLQFLWLKAGMPQYYSCWQKGGTVFFQEQAKVFEKRSSILKWLNSSDFAPMAPEQCPEKADEYSHKPHSSEAFRKVCTELSDLDLIVLRARKPGLYKHVWFAPATMHIPVEGEQDRKARIPFFIYYCSDYRS